MPDIDPAALTRSDSFSQALNQPIISTKLNGIIGGSLQKSSKASTSAQRVDLEPLYTSLKGSIGEHWAEYKETISLFVLGRQKIRLIQEQQILIPYLLRSP